MSGFRRCLCVAALIGLAMGCSKDPPPPKPPEPPPQPVKEQPKAAKVELTDKASDEWILKKAEPGAKVISDRDYVFSSLPEEITGGAYVLRNSADFPRWLPPGAVKADNNVMVYAILRTHYLKKEEADEIQLGKLKKDGWEEVKGDIKATFNAGEGWRWKAFKKQFNKGPLFIQPESVSFDVPVVFVFK